MGTRTISMDLDTYYRDLDLAKQKGHTITRELVKEFKKLCEEWAGGYGSHAEIQPIIVRIHRLIKDFDYNEPVLGGINGTATIPL